MSNVIQYHQPKEILDLRASKGYFSLLAASYGAHVDAVDDMTVSGEFPDYLKSHTNITFIDSTVEDFPFKKKYDFVIMKHIIMYHPKEYIFTKLLPTVHKHLYKEGMIFLTYHLPDSYLMKKEPGLHQYHLQEFKDIGSTFEVKDFGTYTNPVKGVPNKKQHVEYVVLKKV